ncbi:asparagine synthase-related protein [Psychrobacter sp. 219-2-C]|uniref:asparagine synthase-related protein n=1 Tax=Psychrobacter sp. 219-2-C TaxID=3414707 RepID=UPI003C6E0B89
MPGIYGVVSKKDAKSNLQSMSKSMYLYDHFIQDELFYDGSVAASRVHTGLVGTDHSPVKLNDLYVWVEGEAYNISEVAKELNLKSNSLPTLLVKADESNQLDKCLNRLDGYFCAAIYDKKLQKIKLISDRYGMRLLYWYHKNAVFAWGSEVKAILAIKDIDKELNPTSYDCFMDLGYLVDEHTWFKHMKLIKPASVVEYDLNTNTSKQHYYWKWSDIEPCKLSFNDAVDKLGGLLVSSVSKRLGTNERIGLSLSGGLDSRVLFATLDYLQPEYHGYAYTFGVPNCVDVNIAKKVIASSKNWYHDTFFFNSKNWFEPRFEKIWNTDGMQDMQHMHGTEFFDITSSKMDINLNGYAGGLLTGEWVNSKTANQRVDHYHADKLLGRHTNLAPHNIDFYDINHIEPYIYMNRNRRATNMGTVNNLVKIEQRKPLMDNEIVTFLMSLPDEYRINNRLYSAMLQKHFPKYFKSIPWSRTGKPVAKTNTLKSIPNRALRKAKRQLHTFLGIKSNQNYTDYPTWIREREVSSQLLQLLDPINAEYARLTNDDLSKRWLEPHLNDKRVNNTNQILRAATIEIYLRQVFR